MAKNTREQFQHLILVTIDQLNPDNPVKTDRNNIYDHHIDGSINFENTPLPEITEILSWIIFSLDQFNKTVHNQFGSQVSETDLEHIGIFRKNILSLIDTIGLYLDAYPETSSNRPANKIKQKLRLILLGSDIAYEAVKTGEHLKRIEAQSKR